MHRFAFTSRSWAAVCVAAGMLLLGGLAGCAQISARVPQVIQAPYKPKNVTGDARLPDLMHRVVVLPVAANGVATPETAESLDPLFVQALERRGRFEVVPVSRVELRQRWRKSEFSSVEELPVDLMAELAHSYGAEGVMFIDITSSRSYPPLALGVRAKLALTASGRIVWAIDEVFSAGDASVAEAAHLYAVASDRGGMPVDTTPAVLQSPSRFAGYVADAIFSTLPPR